MSKPIYRLLDRPFDGLVILVSIDGRQLWVRTKTAVRKVCQCQICGAPLRGSLAYRPLMNVSNRSHRLCVPCVDSMPVWS